MNKETHIKYEELKPFLENTNFLEKMRKVSNPIVNENDDEESKLDALLDLRRLHKFYYDFFLKIFDNILYGIKDVLRTKNLELQYEALSLLKEVFDHHKYYATDIGDWVQKLLPRLLDIYLDKNEHYDITNQIILNITHYLLYPETIETFLEEINDSRDQDLSNAAFTFLMLSLESLNTFDLQETMYWSKLIELLYDIFKSGNGKAIYAQKTLNFIMNKLGKTKLDEILNIHSTPKMKITFVDMVKEITQGEVNINRNNNHLYK